MDEERKRRILNNYLQKTYGDDVENAPENAISNFMADHGVLDDSQRTRINETIEKNKNVPFVERIINRQDYPSLDLGEGKHATHLMGYAEKDGKYYVYPNVQIDDERIQLKDYSEGGGNWRKAFDRALQEGNVIPFENERDARIFSKNYKEFWKEPGGFVPSVKDIGLSATTEPMKDFLNTAISAANDRAKSGFADPNEEAAFNRTVQVQERLRGKPLDPAEVDEIRSQYQSVPPEQAIRQTKEWKDILTMAEAALPDIKERDRSKVTEAVMGFARFFPSMAATAATGGGGALVTLSQLYGQKYGELRDRGINHDNADAAAFATAIMSTPVEYAGNVFQLKLLKPLARSLGMSTKASGKALDFLTKARGSIPGRVLAGGGRASAGGGAEGGEEFIQAYAEAAGDVLAENPGADTKTLLSLYNQKITSPEFIESRNKATELGAIGGFLFGGGGAALGETIDYRQKAAKGKATQAAKDQAVKLKTSIDNVRSNIKKDLDSGKLDIDRVRAMRQNPKAVGPMAEMLDDILAEYGGTETTAFEFPRQTPEEQAAIQREIERQRQGTPQTVDRVRQAAEENQRKINRQEAIAQQAARRAAGLQPPADIPGSAVDRGQMNRELVRRGVMPEQDVGAIEGLEVVASKTIPMDMKGKLYVVKQNEGPSYLSLPPGETEPMALPPGQGFQIIKEHSRYSPEFAKWLNQQYMALPPGGAFELVGEPYTPGPARGDLLQESGEGSAAARPEPPSTPTPETLEEAAVKKQSETPPKQAKKPEIKKEEGEIKEPWQMTKAEYLQGRETADEISIGQIGHAKHVKKAVERGKPVPDEVLADYKNNTWAKVPGLADEFNDLYPGHDLKFDGIQDRSAINKPPMYSFTPQSGPLKGSSFSAQQASVEYVKDGFDTLVEDNVKAKEKAAKKEQGKQQPAAAGTTDVVPYTDAQLKKTPKKPWQNPNTVFRELRDSNSRLLGFVTEPYDGTKKGAIEAAKRITDRADELGDWSNVNSRIGATDENSAPKFTVSPNFKNVSDVNTETDAARYTWGDLSSEPDERPTYKNERMSGVADRFTPGETVKTSSGRETAPFPNVDMDTDRKSNNSVKRVDRWLIDEAIKEAKSRGDDFNLRQFENEDPNRLPPASKDAAEEYLFGEKPLTPPKGVDTLKAQPQRKGAQDEPIRRPSQKTSPGKRTGDLPTDVRDGGTERVSQPESGRGRETERVDDELGDERPGSRRSDSERTVRPVDYRISPDDQLGHGGPKKKFSDNIEAIRTLKAIGDGVATKADQAKLVKYVGWGGMPQAFPRPGGFITKGWEKEVDQLREILTDEEYAAAKRSTQDAHYTSEPIINSMYAGVQRIGFKSGKVLEPSVGTGNFLGLMPFRMRTRSKVTGIELDPITAGIAKKLYPNQNIVNSGFEEITIKPDSFDMAIGNPPFGEQKLYDAENKDLRKFSIHNYFFAKSLKGLKPNGILSMVVSSSMMDKRGGDQRQWITENAELLGAVRLPNNAFKATAGTEVTTDIIFMRKRAEGEQPGPNELKWQNLKEVDGEGAKYMLNEYFADHPSMMLGTPAPNKLHPGEIVEGVYKGAPGLVSNGKFTEASLASAIESLPKDIYQQGKTIAEVERPELVVSDPGFIQPYGYGLDQDGNPVRRLPDENGEQRFERVEYAGKPLAGTRLDRFKGMMKLRDVVRSLIRAEIADDPRMGDLRKQLNKEYNAFTKKHGYISSNANSSVINDDPIDLPLLKSLEVDFDPGVSPTIAKRLGVKPSSPSAKKAAIFRVRTRRPYSAATSAKDAKEGLAVSLRERGIVDLDHISELTGMPKADIASELNGIIFKNPSSSEWETAENYLSGNVKKKLADAETAAARDKSFRANVDALKEVQPDDVPPDLIGFKVGATWIPTELYEDFASEVLKNNITVSYLKDIGVWSVKVPRGTASEFDSNKMSAGDIFERMIKSADIAVYYRDRDGNRVFDKEGTVSARSKSDDINQAFQDWILNDSKRRDQISKVFNDVVNTNVEPSFDGSHMIFPGMGIIDSSKPRDDQLRPHQKNYVWRTIQKGKGLADHVVGSGKTFASIAAGMEMKRMGLIQKPSYVVPNHLVGQWATDFQRLYPGANTLVINKKDFSKKKRQEFLGKIATGDWDAVVIAHSSFGFINMPRAYEKRFYEDQVRQYERAIDEIKREEGKKTLTVKQMEKAKDKLKVKLKSLAEKPKDNVVDFSELGVDALFIDEAHEFKNLFYATKRTRVAGLGNPQGSKKAFDMFVKSRYILENNGDRGVFFLTGTPVSNSISEMYTMMRYLDYDRMKDMGIRHFDQWSNMFADAVSGWEVDPTGTRYRLQTKLDFTNLPGLMAFYKDFADVITQNDLKEIAKKQNKVWPIPSVKGGKPENVIAKRSDLQESFFKWIVYRFDNMPKDPKDDNPLKATGEAMKASLDIRLINPALQDFEGSKVNLSVKNMVNVYRKWSPKKGTQLVFCDLSVPKKAKGKHAKEIQDLRTKIKSLETKIEDETDSDKLNDLEAQYIRLTNKYDKYTPAELMAADSDFSVYDDIKAKLIKKGVGETEVAFIHDANTEAQKEKLFSDVRNGRVRILIGSTSKMGAGMNVQNRLVALHHLDAPWRPSDLEQREGRIVRQGNDFFDAYLKGGDKFDVEIYRYATKQTLDTRRWQIIERKAKTIEQLRKGGHEWGEKIDDATGEAANAAEMKAAASGNPLILKEIQVSQQLDELELKKRGDRSQRFAFERKVKEYEDFNRNFKDIIADLKADKALVDSNPKDGTPKGWNITVDGNTFRAAKDNEKALKKAKSDYKKYVDKHIGHLLDEGVRNPSSVKIKFRGVNYTAERNGGFVDVLPDFRAADQYWSHSGGGFRLRVGDDFSADGFLIRLDNSVDSIPKFYDATVRSVHDRLKRLKNNSENAKKGLSKQVNYDDRIKDLREQHQEILKQLQSSESDKPKETQDFSMWTSTPRRPATRKEVSQPDESEDAKFYVYMKDAPPRPVPHAKSVKIVDWIETFIHKDENAPWVVSEKSTGAMMGKGITKQAAINDVKEKIEKYGKSNVLSIIAEQPKIDDSLGRKPGSQAKSILKNDLGSSELATDVYNFAFDLVNKGVNTYRAFREQMREKFKSIWAKIKDHIKAIFDILNNQRGEVGPDIGKGNKFKEAKVTEDDFDSYFGEAIEAAETVDDATIEQIRQDDPDTFKKLKGWFGRGYEDDGDMKWYHRAFGNPYFLGKKFPSVGRAVDIEIEAAEKRSNELFNDYSGALDEYQRTIPKSKKKLQELRDVIWKWEGRRFPKSAVSENWYTENDDGTIKANPEHYDQVESYLLRGGHSPDVVGAFMAIRRKLDEKFVDISSFLQENLVDPNEIQEFRASIGKIHNYFPHRRVGNAFIQVTDKEGEVVYREHVNTLNKLKNRPDQVEDRVKAWLQNEIDSGSLPGTMADYKISNLRKVKQLPDEVFFQVPVEAMQQIVNVAGGNLERSRVQYEADRLYNKEGKTRDEALKLAKSRLRADMQKALSVAVADVFKSRGWGSHAIKRKNIPGHDTEDVFGILFDYLSGYAGFKTKIERARQHHENLNNLEAKQKPDEWKYLSKYVRDMLANQDKTDRVVDTIRGVFFVKYLGFVPKSALINLSQNLVMAGPVLSRHTKRSHRKLAKAMIDVRKALTSKDAWLGKEVSYGRLTEDEQSAIKTLIADGAAQDLFLRELKGHLPGNGWAKYYKKAIDGSGMMMQVAERFNRTSTGLAAYRVAREKGKSHNEAIKFAKEIIYDSHFLYGKANLPSFARGGDAQKLARSAYTFRSFTHNYLASMAHLLKNQGIDGKLAAIRSIRNVIIVGGLSSAPFFDDMLNALLWVIGKDDKDAMTLVRSVFPKTWMKDLVTYGLPGLAGMDFSGSLSIEFPKNWVDIIGVPYSIYDDTTKMAESWKSGQKFRAISETPFTPMSMRNAMRGIELYTQGQMSRSGRDINAPGKPGPRKITGREAIQKSLFGIQPTSVSKGYGAYQAQRKTEDFVSKKKKRFADRYANALKRGDEQERANIIKEIQAWNDNARKSGNPQNVIDLRDAIRSRLKPGIKSIPRNLRGKALDIHEQWE
jgi:N12 class adenine-specific DNA methylase/predicted RNA methylase